MTMSFNPKAQSAFKKLGAATLFTVAIVAVATMFIACHHTADNAGSGSGGDAETSPTYTVGGISFTMKDIAAVENTQGELECLQNWRSGSNAGALESRDGR